MRKIIFFIAIYLLIATYPNIHHKEKKIHVFKDKKQLINYWVKYYSRLYNLDEKLVLAIIDLESNYNHKAKCNKSTAYGLGQFIHSTGKWIYSKIYNKKYSHYSTSIEEQVHMQCYYLRYLNRKYNYNTKLVLKEYSGNTKGYIEAIKIRYKGDLI